jgi:hypothetical protein
MLVELQMCMRIERLSYSGRTFGGTGVERDWLTKLIERGDIEAHGCSEISDGI